MTTRSRRMGPLTSTIIALVAVVPTTLSAQTSNARGAWTITPMAGVFSFDFADDENFPFFALRLDRPTGKWTRFEVEGSYGRPDVQSDANGLYAPGSPEKKSRFVTISISVQARYRLDRVEPYGGIAFGFFTRRDDDADGVRFSRTTFGFPAGVRVFLTDRVGLRGEVRLRRDQSTIGAPSFTNIEKTVGLSYKF
jgi:opacity protein-like surface antigen